MTVTRFLMPCFYLTISTSALAVNWVYVTTSSNDSEVFIDTDSIKSAGSYSDEKRAWIQIDHSKNSKVTLRSEKLLYSAKCNAEELKLIQWIEYMPDGSVKDSGKSNTYTPHSSVAPETVGSSILNAICTTNE